LEVQKDLSNNNELFDLDIDKSNNLLNYLLFAKSFRKNIIVLFARKVEGIDNELEPIRKIKKLNFLSKNHHIINILKSYQKSIYNLLCRINDTYYKLPINNLDNYLSQSYIKYILEFYEIILSKNL
jgi:hypothetical protein